MHRTRTRTPLLALAGALVASAVGLIPARPAAAVLGSYDVTQRVSTGTLGNGGPNDIDNNVLVDASGRYVFFNTDNKLLPEDHDATWDAYRFDRIGNRLQIISVEGKPGEDAPISNPMRTCGVSRNGRFVGFTVTYGAVMVQVLQHDLLTGGYAQASLSNGGSPAAQNGGNAISPESRCAVSNDGRYVAFQAAATNLVPGNVDIGSDVYRRDLQNDTIELASQSSGSTKGDGISLDLAMSADGSAIAFTSTSTNLVASDSNAMSDVFLRLPGISTTLRMSVKTGGGQIPGASGHPSISADGTYVAFESNANQIVVADNNGFKDVFLRNRTAGTTKIVSLTDADTSVNEQSYNPAVSDDGRYVSFGSLGTNLPQGDEVPDEDHMFRRDLQTGSTIVIDLGPTGNIGDDESYGQSISGDGRVVAFASKATNLDQSDNSTVKDAFVRDLAVSTAPFDAAATWISQQWMDFYGHAATGNDLEIGVGQLRHGKASLESIVDDLAHSPEFSAKRGPLVRLYWAYFLRPPDTGGLTYWTKKLTTGSTLAWVSQQFAKSNEFQTKYGSLSNQAFVTLIYQNIFERDPDAGGLAYWTGKLDKKQKTRGDVMVNFSESSEGKRFLAPQVDTVLIWFGMLRTAPSKSTVTGWIEAIRDGGEPAERVVQVIRAMPAYINRFS